MSIEDKSKLLGSVRARIAMWFTLVLAGALIVFSVAVYFAMWNALASQMETELSEGTRALAENLDHEFEEGDSVQDAVDSVVFKSSFRNLAVRVYQPDGQIVATSDDFTELQIDPSTIPFGANGSRNALRMENLDTQNYKIAATRVRHKTSKQVYTIVVGARQASIQGQLATLRTLLIALTPILLLLASVGGFYLAKRTLRPVAAMTAQAKKMNARNLSERLTVEHPNDELGQLAATFNELFERIEKSFAQMRQFMADASHELRTPTAVIRSEAEVALTEPREESEAFASLEVINEEAVRLTRLVDDMFALARADEGLHDIRSDEKVSMSELVHACARAAQTLGKSKEIEVVVRNEIPDTVYCSGDRIRLSQLLLILLDNAIKYTQPGGGVTIRAVAKEILEGFVAEITVADNGPGIPKEYGEKIFERFFRMDAARSRTGTGLGLPIAREIARFHRGSLVLKNNDGGGAEFKITLPIIGLNGSK